MKLIMSGCQFPKGVDNGIFWINRRYRLFLLTLSTVRVACIPCSQPSILSGRAWHGWTLDTTHLTLREHTQKKKRLCFGHCPKVASTPPLILDIAR